MKEWVIKFRAKDMDNFREVEEGLKIVETRAATPKYRRVAEGDTLVFSCGSRKLKKKVKRVRIFKNIPEMLKEVNLKSIMPSVSSEEEARVIYYGYPGYREKIKKHGIVAWDI